MLDKLLNIFRIPDLRKRVLFTLFILAIYRLGSHIPTPGVNAKLLEQFFSQNSGSSLGLIDMFSGGNLRKLTVFALGIMPYITAAIIFELLTVVYEPLARLQKEGDMGRKKITQWTRYMTVFLAVVQSFAIALTLVHGSGSVPYVTNPGPGFVLMTILTLTTGATFVMWLGEQITDRGIGEGMSLLIFAGIVVGIPNGIGDLVGKVQTAGVGRIYDPCCHHPAGRHAGGGCVHRVCGTQRAAHSCAVCEADRRATPDGRPIDALAAACECRRCDAGDFRGLDFIGAVAGAAHGFLPGQPLLPSDL